MPMWSVILFFICVQDVETDGKVSVMEGDSITLHTGLTEIQKDDTILWIFGPPDTRIADIYKQNITIYDEKFRGIFQLDITTGSLTIKNIRSSYSGLYKLTIFSKKGVSHKAFPVTVYAPVSTPVISTNSRVTEQQTPPRLPIPVISTDSCQCSSSSESSSKCVLVCSVVNVTQVTLSWYKGNSLFSSISVSDLNSSLSLPLEVEYQENNIYSCVITNPIRNQTKHLNINDVCQTCSDPMQCYGFTEAVIRLVISALVGVATVAVLVEHLRSRRV
ncbi:uncharacterized protein LOC127438844 [Myxocyprinus asiaticus]|uniref:uncharacterized protein LOC127438844 n=1 Tax=Myxocyprinus asiaticus TaxID=70543 RepID=UPI0022236A12|nr:uncharacterized protein LOC127438844 [Myxocyprinus asiaticus]